jgi:hypothetical protein
LGQETVLAWAWESAKVWKRMLAAQRAAAQAWPVEAHDEHNRPATTGSTKTRLAGAAFVLVHKLGEFVELIGRDAKRFGGMIANGRHHLVVQIGDDSFCLAIQFLGRFAELRIQLAPNPFEWGVGLGTVLLIHVFLSPSVYRTVALHVSGRSQIKSYP